MQNKKKPTLHRTTFRLPIPLWREIERRAEYHGVTNNAEVTSMLSYAVSTADQLAQLTKEVAELKAILLDISKK